MDFNKSLIMIIAVKVIVFNVAPIAIQETSRFAMTYGISKLYGYLTKPSINVDNFDNVLLLTNDKNDDDVTVVYKYKANKYSSETMIVLDNN